MKILRYAWIGVLWLVMPVAARAQWVSEFSISYASAANTGYSTTNAGGAGLTDETATGVVGMAYSSHGTGYTSVPSVSIAAPASGVQATAHMTINAGAATFVPDIAGSGYSATMPPTVTVTGGGGTGFAATAQVGSWRINSHALQTQGNWGQAYYNWLDRPAIAMQQRIVATFTMATGTTVPLIFRGNHSSFSCYEVMCSGTQLQIWYHPGGENRTQLGTNYSYTALNNGDTYTLDASIVYGTGASSTVNATLTDTTTSTVVENNVVLVANDTSPGVQIANGPGYYGVGSQQAHSIGITSLAFYNQPLFGISPSSVTLNTTQAITLTAVGETWTPGTPGSPTFAVMNSNGTGVSVVSQVVTDAGHCTLTIASADVGGGLIVTENASNATAVLFLLWETVGGPALVSSTSTTVTLSCPAAVNAVGTVSYYLYRSMVSGLSPPTACTLVGTQTGVTNGVAPSNFTDTPPKAYPAPTYYYSVVAMDSAGQVAISTGQATVAWSTRFVNFRGNRIH